jgi:hypothetical protein
VTKFSDGPRAAVRCYGADDVREGVAIMWKEGVDVSITGNSTNPTRFQHPVAGTYKKECVEKGKKYFSVASGGGTGRTLHPDNIGRPASYGMTDTMAACLRRAVATRTVPAHVEMMGFSAWATTRWSARPSRCGLVGKSVKNCAARSSFMKMTVRSVLLRRHFASTSFSLQTYISKIMAGFLFVRERFDRLKNARIFSDRRLRRKITPEDGT